MIKSFYCYEIPYHNTNKYASARAFYIPLSCVSFSTANTPVSLAGNWHKIGRSNVAMPSTAIKSYEYIPAEQRLRITFVSGAVYDYLGVPAEVHAAMKVYRSKGTFVNQEIKGHYPFQKVALS